MWGSTLSKPQNTAEYIVSLCDFTVVETGEEEMPVKSSFVFQQNQRKRRSSQPRQVLFSKGYG